MLISHEVPIALLYESMHFNDYDYCLLHLLLENEKYREYYIEAHDIFQRDCILDNSVFELGTALTPEMLLKGIEMIHPTWYIIPDVLDDREATCKNIAEFPHVESSKSIGAVQGSTFGELERCYTFAAEHCDKIAIPFHSAAYTPFLGRLQFIMHLVREGIWRKDKPHHLLGATLPIEFASYREVGGIESIDTSNPVVAAMEGVEYDLTGFGVTRKPGAKMNDLMMKELAPETLHRIRLNIKIFRELANGSV